VCVQWTRTYGRKILLPKGEKWGRSEVKRVRVKSRITAVQRRGRAEAAGEDSEGETPGRGQLRTRRPAREGGGPERGPWKVLGGRAGHSVPRPQRPPPGDSSTARGDSSTAGPLRGGGRPAREREAPLPPPSPPPGPPAYLHAVEPGLQPELLNHLFHSGDAGRARHGARELVRGSAGRGSAEPDGGAARGGGGAPNFVSKFPVLCLGLHPRRACVAAPPWVPSRRPRGSSSPGALGEKGRSGRWARRASAARPWPLLPSTRRLVWLR
jgi:hypothetical protein